MYDIHTHLYWHTYDTDRDAVIERARQAGVEKMFVIGCTVEESRQAVELAQKHENVYASVGIHPQFFSEFTEKQFPISNSQFPNKSRLLNDQIQTFTEELRTLAKDERVIAIGECGLEYYSHHELQIISSKQKTAQKEGFLAQIDLAQELGLPLIVHCRASTGSDDVYQDLFKILKADSYQLKAIVLHCYMGDTEVTKQFLTLPNVYFSFTGNVTYPIKKRVAGTKDDLSETVKLVPLERLFTETDCPFLAPQSRRGGRNEPAYVAEVVAKIAELHEKTVGEVERAIEYNVGKVFLLS